MENSVKLFEWRRISDYYYSINICKNQFIGKITKENMKKSLTHTQQRRRNTRTAKANAKKRKY